jgi:two-component system copper resistance phosphate regulon response regulator CusR
MNLLIVEDDESVASFLKQATVEAGFAPQLADDGLDALEMARSGDFDLILLDVMVPRLDGFEICRRLRAANVATPILIITARDLLDDKVKGLDSGADDYIVKPFQVAELLARVRALLRRGSSSPVVLRVGDLSLDPVSRQVMRAGNPISLSTTEYTLLEYLMRNAGRVLTRSMLLEHVWQYDFGGNDNVLDVYVSYLRRKIDRGYTPALIHTVRGVGYMVSGYEAA